MRARLARRLSIEIKAPTASRSLIEIADVLDHDAEKLEHLPAAAEADNPDPLS